MVRMEKGMQAKEQLDKVGAARREIMEIETDLEEQSE